MKRLVCPACHGTGHRVVHPVGFTAAPAPASTACSACAAGGILASAPIGFTAPPAVPAPFLLAWKPTLYLPPGLGA